MPGVSEKEMVAGSIAKAALLHLNQSPRYATRNAQTRDCQVAAHVSPRCRVLDVPQRRDTALPGSSHCRARHAKAVAYESRANAGNNAEVLFDDCCENVSSMVSAGVLLKIDARVWSGWRLQAKHWRWCLFIPQARFSFFTLPLLLYYTC